MRFRLWSVLVALWVLCKPTSAWHCKIPVVNFFCANPVVLDTKFEQFRSNFSSEISVRVSDSSQKHKQWESQEIERGQESDHPILHVQIPSDVKSWDLVIEFQFAKHYPGSFAGADCAIVGGEYNATLTNCTHTDVEYPCLFIKPSNVSGLPFDLICHYNQTNSLRQSVPCQSNSADLPCEFGNGFHMHVKTRAEEQHLLYSLPVSGSSTSLTAYEISMAVALSELAYHSSFAQILLDLQSKYTWDPWFSTIRAIARSTPNSPISYLIVVTGSNITSQENKSMKYDKVDQLLNTSDSRLMNDPNRAIWIVFAGSSNAADWALNIQLATKIESEGQSHSGYLSRAQSVPLRALLTKNVEQNFTIRCVGHSAGGAVASLLTLQLLEAQHAPQSILMQQSQGHRSLPSIQAITFGAPFFANSAKLRWATSHGWHYNLHHFINRKDPIPVILSFRGIESVLLNTVGLQKQLREHTQTWDKIKNAFDERFGGNQTTAQADLLAGAMKAMKDVFMARVADYQSLGKFHHLTFELGKQVKVSVNVHLNDAQIYMQSTFEDQSWVDRLIEQYDHHTISSYKRILKYYSSVNTAGYSDVAIHTGIDFLIPSPEIVRLYYSSEIYQLEFVGKNLERFHTTGSADHIVQVFDAGNLRCLANGILLVHTEEQLTVRGKWNSTCGVKAAQMPAYSLHSHFHSQMGVVHLVQHNPTEHSIRSFKTDWLHGVAYRAVDEARSLCVAQKYQDCTTQSQLLELIQHFSREGSTSTTSVDQEFHKVRNLAKTRPTKDEPKPFNRTVMVSGLSSHYASAISHLQNPLYHYTSTAELLAGTILSMSFSGVTSAVVGAGTTLSSSSFTLLIAGTTLTITAPVAIGVGVGVAAGASFVVLNRLANPPEQTSTYLPHLTLVHRTLTGKTDSFNIETVLENEIWETIADRCDNCKTGSLNELISFLATWNSLKQPLHNSTSVFAQLTRTSQDQWIGFIRQVLRIRAMRNIMEQSIYVAFAGAHNAGKSNLIQRLFGFDTRPGSFLNFQTSEIGIYPLCDASEIAQNQKAGHGICDIYVAEIPGFNTNDAAIASQFELFQQLASYLFFLIGKGDDHSLVANIMERAEDSQISHHFIHNRLCDSHTNDDQYNIFHHESVLPMAMTDILERHGLSDHEVFFAIDEQLCSSYGNVANQFIKEGKLNGNENVRREIIRKLTQKYPTRKDNIIRRLHFNAAATNSPLHEDL